MKRILLWDLETLMLVVDCPSGVLYQNQVGGNVAWQAEHEGVLAPVQVFSEVLGQIESLDYPNGTSGIPVEIADALDAIFAAHKSMSGLRVDRARLAECWEAWVYVTIESPESDTVSVHDSGSLFGFGKVSGVLTWSNSD